MEYEFDRRPIRWCHPKDTDWTNPETHTFVIWEDIKGIAGYKPIGYTITPPIVPQP